MKNKYLFIKIFGIAFLLFSIFIYFIFYFVPFVKDVNHYKRELKDMNLKIKNFFEMEKEFSFSNERERAFFKEADDDLMSKISEVKSKEDFIALFTIVFNYIKKLARTDGLYNMVLTSNSKELELNATTLSTDKKSLDRLLHFAKLRINELRNKMDVSKETVNPTVPSTQPLIKQPLLENLNYQTIFLSFSGDLQNAMTFINHIPWSSYYLRPGDILVSIGEISPYYMVFLKVYFIDLR